MKYVVLPLSLLSALLLSGCDAATLGALTGGGKIPSSFLTSYKATVAGAKGAPATFEDAQKTGLEGFGAGTPGSQAAADVVGVYKTGSIKGDANSLTVTVDGHSYTMPAVGLPGTGVFTDSNNHKLRVYAYGHTDGNHWAQGDAAIQFGIDDASLTIFVKNIVQTYDQTQSVWNATYDGYSIIAAGRETLPGHLPTVVASYKGTYYVIAGLGSSSANSGDTVSRTGSFDATVNFAASKNQVSITSDAFSGNGSIVSGTNKFKGNVSGDFTGSVAGGFYGPSAEQTAGVGVGKMQGKDGVVGFVGTQNLGTPVTP